MRSHVLDSLVLFCLHVRDFAHPDVCRALSRVIDRMIGPEPNVLSVLAIPEPKLQPENGAQRNEAVEYDVVAHGPRHTTQNDDAGRQSRPREPARLLTPRA